MELILARGQHGKSTFFRRRRRRLLLAGLTIAVLSGLAIHQWLVPRIRHRYRAWHQERALNQAREFAQAGDGPNASLALQIALRDDSTSPAAWRLAAEILEQSGNAQAISVRKDIIRLPAATGEDRLALALTAIRFGDLASAADALREVPAGERNSPAVRRVTAQFALAANQPAFAHALLDAFARDHPADRSLAFALAALRLRLPDPVAAQAARADVENFAREPEFALRALRELTLDALFRREQAAAAGYAARLVAAPGAAFTDQLTAANVALLLEHREPATVLAPLMPLAGRSPEDASAFLSWLLAQNRGADALVFLRQQPEPLARAPGLRNLHAAAVAALGDWHTLGALLRDGAWGPIAPEVVDLALAAHTADGRNRPDLRRSLWQEALAGGQRSLATLRILHRLAAGWRWESETIDTLQAIAAAFPRELSVHESLARHFAASKTTDRLQDALLHWMDADPGNRRVKNDWAVLAMLRAPTAELDRPKLVAAELLHAEPDNPFFLTAQAFALLQLGQIADALALVEKLPPTERDLPARAPYLAAIYAAADKAEAARLALERVPTEQLLPEETALVRSVRAQVISPATDSFR